MIYGNHEIHYARKRGEIEIYPAPEHTRGELEQFARAGTLYQPRPFPDAPLVRLPPGSAKDERPPYDNTTIRLRLGREFRRLRPGEHISPENIYRILGSITPMVLDIGEEYILAPGESVVAQTIEYLSLPIPPWTEWWQVWRWQCWSWKVWERNFWRWHGWRIRRAKRAVLCGRTRVARTFVFTHVSAPYMNAGQWNVITLELFNASKNPVHLTVGNAIEALEFEDVFGRIEVLIHACDGHLNSCGPEPEVTDQQERNSSNALPRIGGPRSVKP